MFFARVTVTGLSSGVRTRAGAAVERDGTQLLRVQAREPVAFAEELGPGQQPQGRVREHKDDDEVDDSRQAKGEGKAADVADCHEEQHDGGKEVHGLGGEDGALCPLPAVFHGGDQAAAFTELIADAFEVDDERVRRLADGYDQARDAGQRKPVVLGPAEDRDGQVCQDPGDHQGRDGHEAQGPVLEERVDHHEQQADEAGDQTHPKLVSAERGGDLLFALDFEADRQGTETELVGQGLGGFPP